uniref:Uncharacterized protein n=1 Tax=Anopheles dirus TaxID=7168 RepID=A0A182NX90_9DIPT
MCQHSDCNTTAYITGNVRIQWGSCWCDGRARRTFRSVTIRTRIPALYILLMIAHLSLPVEECTVGLASDFLKDRFILTDEEIAAVA